MGFVLVVVRGGWIVATASDRTSKFDGLAPLTGLVPFFPLDGFLVGLMTHN